MLDVVVRWKRKLRAIGFEGSVSSWPDSFGDDLLVEAVPFERSALKSVSKAFKVGFGGNDTRTASELLRDFRLCLAGVYGDCQGQVLKNQSPLAKCAPWKLSKRDRAIFLPQESKSG